MLRKSAERSFRSRSIVSNFVCSTARNRSSVDAAFFIPSRAIVPGGRLVWLSPRPKTTNTVLERSGMKRDRDFIVDMRGFVAHLQHWSR